MTRPRILILAILSIVLLLAGATVAMANHSAVNGGIVKLLKSDGSQAGPTDAYSPKATCAGCHIKDCIAQNTIPTNTMKW
jgi:cytochrome c553